VTLKIKKATRRKRNSLCQEIISREQTRYTATNFVHKPTMLEYMVRNRCPILEKSKAASKMDIIR
jgi:hypothetical protein